MTDIDTSIAEQVAQTVLVNKRNDTADGLQAAADFIRGLDPESTWCGVPSYALDFTDWISDRETFASAVSQLGGQREKGVNYNDDLYVERKFSNKVSLRLVLSEPCRMVPTGKFEEYEEVVELAPAETVTITKTREVMSKDCGNVLDPESYRLV